MQVRRNRVSCSRSVSWSRNRASGNLGVIQELPFAHPCTRLFRACVADPQQLSRLLPLAVLVGLVDHWRDPIAGELVEGGK